MTLLQHLPRRCQFPGAVAALALVALFSIGSPQPANGAEAGQGKPVCIECHSTLPDPLGTPAKLWPSSVHAENGISCDACHGGDPKDAAHAMDRTRGFLGAPKEVDIPAFCGRCHPGVLKDYSASPHGMALGKGGPSCVTCHGNHAVVKASLDLINEKNCTKCHTFERAQAIKEAMQQTETTIVSIDGRIKAYQGEGVDTEQMGKELFAARNRFHTLFHEQSVEKVKAESTQILSELRKLKQALNAIDESHRKRRIAGGFVVGGLLLMALLFHLLKKSYD